MRPTQLGFRSPKERTPEPNYPRVTYDGRLLNFSSPKSSKKSSSFSLEKRFKNYDNDAKKTNFRIGPGSYSPNNLSIGKAKIQGGYVYKSYLLGTKIANNGYYFVNDNLVYEPMFVIKSKRGSFDTIDCEAEVSTKACGSYISKPKSSEGSSRTEASHKFMRVKKFVEEFRSKTPCLAGKRSKRVKAPLRSQSKKNQINKLLEKRFKDESV